MQSHLRARRAALSCRGRGFDERMKSDEFRRCAHCSRSCPITVADGPRAGAGTHPSLAFSIGVVVKTTTIYYGSTLGLLRQRSLHLTAKRIPVLPPGGRGPRPSRPRGHLLLFLAVVSIAVAVVLRRPSFPYQHYSAAFARHYEAPVSLTRRRRLTTSDGAIDLVISIWARRYRIPLKSTGVLFGCTVDPGLGKHLDHTCKWKHH